MHHLHLTHAIGCTPIVELQHCSPKPGVRLFAKLEGFNPTGSVKDRIVREMLLAAEREPGIRPGDTVIEASTGNTGIALAMVGSASGYDVRIVMPENVYPEIPRAVEVYGASFIGDNVLYLKPGTKEWFMPFLRETYPHLLPQYERFYRGAYAPRSYSQDVASTVQQLRERAGLTPRHEEPKRPVGQLQMAI